MTSKLDYRWNLREVMAHEGIYSTSALGPLLAERGIQLSSSQIYRLVTDKPERLNLKVLMALLDILGCSMEALVEPVAHTSATTYNDRRAASGGGHEAGVGSFRPRRARIDPPPP